MLITPPFKNCEESYYSNDKCSKTNRKQDYGFLHKEPVYRMCECRLHIGLPRFEFCQHHAEQKNKKRYCKQAVLAEYVRIIGFDYCHLKTSHNHLKVNNNKPQNNRIQINISP